MSPLQLTIPWEDFRSGLQVLVEQAEQLRSTPVQTGDELADFDLRVKTLDDMITAFLRENFNVQNNAYVREFRQTGYNRFNIPGPGRAVPLDRQIQQAKETLRQKSEYLSYNLHFLNACDAIVRPKTVNFEERAVLTMKQKQQLLLEKLFILYDDYHYPVDELLAGNGVHLQRRDESDELATLLENRGWVEQGGLGGHRTAQLTAEGRETIEESMTPVQENYEDINYSQAEMAAKLDEIKEELIKSGLGHEILFDELQELKELYTKLNKKNWGQLLKGKLVDIAIGKLVDNATLGLIYEAITHHQFHLLT
jgi:hypothetical protein